MVFVVISDANPKRPPLPPYRTCNTLHSNSGWFKVSLGMVLAILFTKAQRGSVPRMQGDDFASKLGEIIMEVTMWHHTPS